MLCENCAGNRVAGQIKLDPAPGGRDPPTWCMRVLDDDGKFKLKGIYHTRKTENNGGSEEYCRNWISRMRLCCGEARHRH